MRQISRLPRPSIGSRDVSILFVSGNGQGILFLDKSYLLLLHKLLKMHRLWLALCLRLGLVRWIFRDPISNGRNFSGS